jgi:hypothetical protein
MSVEQVNDGKDSSHYAVASGNNVVISAGRNVHVRGRTSITTTAIGGSTVVNGRVVTGEEAAQVQAYVAEQMARAFGSWR